MREEKLGGMQAAIFDMDGTLIDSMGEWRKLNCKFLTDQGIEVTAEQEQALFSMTGSMVVEYVREQFGVVTDFSTVVARASQQMKAVYENGVPFKPGAKEYLERLGARGVKRVLCTATPIDVALIALNGMGLIPHLDYIYSTGMLGVTKRHAAAFDKLSDLIGVEKEHCVMFEDALYAMEGAKAAGLRVVAITDETNEIDRDAIHALCDIVIDSFDELE